MSVRDGGPAFPMHTEANAYPNGCPGMSLRDYFAGQALAGMVVGEHSDVWGNSDKAATWAYEFADAMLRARGGEDG